MKVQMEIELNGKTYRSFIEEVDSIREIAFAFKDALIETNSLSLLEDGSYLVIGESALKSCAFIIKPVDLEFFVDEFTLDLTDFQKAQENVQ